MTTERASKDAVPQHKVAFARQRHPPLGLYEKKEAQGTGFCSIRKGVHAFFGQRGFGYSHSFLVLPPMQRILVRMERCTLRAGDLSARVGIVRGAT